MYSIQNKRNSVVAKRIIRSLKNNIYKYITSISKNVYIFKLNVMVFVIKKLKNTVPWMYVIGHLNREEIVGKFYKKELQKTN